MLQNTEPDFQLDSAENHGYLSFAGIKDEEIWKSEDIEREKRFQHLVFGHPINSRIKAAARSGIPCSLRRKIWFFASGGYDLFIATGDVFQDSLKSAHFTNSSEAPDFCSSLNIFEYVPPCMRQDLKKILFTLWNQNRNLELSPLLPSITAMFLLFLEPNLTYLCLQAMLNRSVEDSWYFPIKLKNFTALMHSTARCLSKKCYPLYEHALSLNIDLAQLSVSLYLSFFLPTLPFSVALSLFDSFVIEGRKVLFRFVIALFLRQKKDLLKAKDATSFHQILQEGLQKLATPTELHLFLHEAFSIHLARKVDLVLPAHHQSDDANERNISLNVPALLPGIKLPTTSPQAEITQEVDEFHSETRIGGKYLTNELLSALQQHMPSSLSERIPVLMFSLSVDGNSFRTMFFKTAKDYPGILIIKTDNHLVGSLMSNSFDPKRTEAGNYYGNSLTCVFNARNNQVYKMQKPKNSLFISASDKELMIGGPRAAIYMNQGFKTVISDACQTFNSPKLIDFQFGEKIIDVEIYQYV